MFDPRRMTPTGYPPQPARRPRRRRRPVGLGPKAPLPGMQAGYSGGHFTRTRGVSMPPGTPTARPRIQVGAPGGTSSEEWAFRKGIQEARTTGSTELRRYFAQLGWGGGGGAEEARLGKYLTDLGVEEAEGLAGIRERWQNQFRQGMQGRSIKSRSGVRVHRAGWQERQEREASEAEAKNKAYERWLEEEYYKRFQEGGRRAY